jgi:glycosyltransferase involved in cell wall biosynthesis
MTSRGEGFGVPAIEAQACGTPVIVTNWTAQPELVGSGWKVDGQPEWDEMQTGWWMVPEVKRIIAALEESYEMKSTEQAKAASEAAVAFAAGYTTTKVYAEHWQPILKELEQRITSGAANALNREQRRAAKHKK